MKEGLRGEVDKKDRSKVKMKLKRSEETDKMIERLTTTEKEKDCDIEREKENESKIWRYMRKRERGKKTE